MLDEHLQDCSWQGGWQQEGIVERGKMLGRRSSLVSSAKDCRLQGRWEQNGDVEGGSVLAPRRSLASCVRWKRTR